jgi:hypothetical protein
VHPKQGCEDFEMRPSGWREGVYLKIFGAVRISHVQDGNSSGVAGLTMTNRWSPQIAFREMRGRNNDWRAERSYNPLTPGGARYRSVRAGRAKTAEGSADLLAVELPRFDRLRIVVGRRKRLFSRWRL